MKYAILAVALMVPFQAGAGFFGGNPLARGAECSAEASIEPLQQLSQSQFLNGWGTGGVATSPFKLYKDEKGIVHLQGVIWKFGSSVVQEPALQLPSGYHPSYAEHFAVATQYGYGEALVEPDGEIWITATFQTFTWVSLSGVSFRTR